MKIALVSLGVGAGGFSQFTKRLLNATVALYYIGKILEDAGYEIDIFDQPNNRATDQEIFENLKKENPKIILFAQFFSTRKKIRDLIFRLRSEGGDYIFGVGGHDATFHSVTVPEEYQMFDVIFQGPVSGSIVGDMKKIISNNQGQLIFNTLGQTEDPDLLPVLKHDNYMGTGFLVGSFGCYKKDIGCTFCTTPQFCPTGWRGRRVEAILQEAENLRKSGKNYVFLTDDDCLVDLKRGHEIITGCLEVGLDMMIMTKPKHIVKADNKGYIARWSNVKRVLMGLENGSPKGLAELGKNVGGNVERYLHDCVSAFEILKANKKAPFVGHINFTGPETTFSQLRESAAFLHRLGECDWTALVQNWRPYPGTPAAKKSKYDNDGLASYAFNKEHRVNDFYFLICHLRSETDPVDNLLYSITDEIFIQNPSDEIWQEYRRVKQEWNNLTYNYFIQEIEPIKKKNMETVHDWVGPMGSRTDRFLDDLESIMDEMSALYKKLT